VREQRIGQCTDMRTAICACAVFGDIAYVAQMGDIRAYSLRSGKLGYIDELLKTHAPDALIEARYALEPGDRIVLCSDGVYNCLNEDEIASVLRQHRSPEQAVDGLIKAAIDANLQDNASAAVLNFNRKGGELVPANPNVRRTSIWQTAIFLGVVTLAITLIGLLIFSPQSLSAMVGIAPNPTRAVNDGVVSTRVMAVSTLVSNAETTPTVPVTLNAPSVDPDETKTVEATLVATETATATASATATETATPTPSPTASPTETATPTETSTSTPEPTATETSTATATATITATRPTVRPRPIIRRTATPVAIVTLGAPTEVAAPVQPTAEQPAQPPQQPPSQPDPTKPPFQPPPQPQPTAVPPQPTSAPQPTSPPPPPTEAPPPQKVEPTVAPSP